MTRKRAKNTIANVMKHSVPKKTRHRACADPKLYAILGRRGITLEEIGAHVGLKPRGIYNAVRRDAPSVRARRKIELFLGEPVWTTATDFLRLAKLSAILGFDPVLGADSQVEAFARSAGVPGRLSNRSKAELLKMIEAHFDSRAASAAQPETNAETTTV